MHTRGVRLLVVVAIAALLAGGVLCMFHGDDFHLGAGHLCFVALAAAAVALPLASPGLSGVFAAPLARPFVTLEGLAPPPRG